MILLSIKKPLLLFLITSLMIISGCAQKPKGEFVPFYQAETNKPYDDVLAELEIAISEHNFRITGHSRVGKVIRERGTQNFPEYDTVQFCNLTHAKTLLLIVFGTGRNILSTKTWVRAKLETVLTGRA